MLFGREEKGNSIFCCIAKILPIISLILFVFLHGMNLTEYYRYSRRILIGLIFSLVGDILLVWHDYFEIGLLMFAVAQVCYARAFGWKPFNPYALAVFASVGACVFGILSPGLKGILSYLVAIYIGLICIMGWRAVARVRFFDDLVTWTKLCGCVGSMLFIISDVTIAVNKFVMPVPFHHQIIMLTYYAAQLGITLSVVDSQVDIILHPNQ